MKVLIVTVFILCTLTGYIESGRRKNKSKNKQETEALALTCPPCPNLFCTVRKASKLRCKGGTTTDICGCCPVCAKTAGEACGGKWNYLGKCDAELYCKATSSTSQPIIDAKQGIPFSGLPEGVCTKKPHMIRDERVGTEPAPPTKLPAPPCQPKCTPEYCEKNPRNMCSAIDVVDLKRDCHGSCQHTSCQACSWVDPDPDCGACNQDDFSCIKRFAKCIKRHYCTRSKFPCKLNQNDGAKGKFQCMVPKCYGTS